MGDGYQTELQGMKAYQRAGYWCHKPESRSHPGQTNQDMWNLFDIAAFNPTLEEIRFVQVKTNSTQGELGEWCQRAKHFATVPGVQVEFGVRYDREGWRVIKPGFDGRRYRTVVDTREWDVPIDEGLSMFLRGEEP